MESIRPGASQQYGDGLLTLQFTTIEAAKKDLQIVRAQKQEWTLKRRELDNELARLRSEYQTLIGTLGSSYLRPIPKELQEKSGCLFFKWPVKTHYTKEDERRMHAAAVAPLESEKARYKEAILACDQAIASLNRFVAEQKP